MAQPPFGPKTPAMTSGVRTRLANADDLSRPSEKLLGCHTCRIDLELNVCSAKNSSLYFSYWRDFKGGSFIRPDGGKQHMLTKVDERLILAFSNGNAFS
jgi:hypothetical protein